MAGQISATELTLTTLEHLPECCRIEDSAWFHEQGSHKAARVSATKMGVSGIGIEMPQVAMPSLVEVVSAAARVVSRRGDGIRRERRGDAGSAVSVMVAWWGHGSFMRSCGKPMRGRM